MSLNILKTKGTPIHEQKFHWSDFAKPLLSKLNDDAFTRVRVILMNGIEAETVRFSHSIARLLPTEIRVHLARSRRIDHFQNIMVNWMLPADQSPLETTLGYEQTAIEITASVAQNEPDPYLAQMYRFGMLEDFDHLYRFSALYDRVYGKDANTILQSYTDIRAGRPTVDEHRAPEDDIRKFYNCTTADPVTKLNAVTIISAEHQVRDFYMNIGPTFADPVARMLYAEIVSIEEQHVTHYESFTDPSESPLEKWLIHKANEVYNYHSCVQQESNSKLKGLWERFLDYELGQMQFAIEVFKNYENRDPAEILPETLPDPIEHKSHREFIRKVLQDESELRSRGPAIVSKEEEAQDTLNYRSILNSTGSPSQEIAAGYQWESGTELNKKPKLYDGNGHALRQGV